MNKSSTVLTLALIAAVPSLIAADLTGKVSLKGTPPAAAQQPMKENMCGNPEAYVIKSRQFVVGKDNGLAGAFVYLKSGTGVDGKKFAPSPEKPILDQIHCEYQPYTFGVLAGQTFTVRNSDPVLHNVNSTRAKKNTGKNFGQPTKGQVNDLTFPNPEFIQFRCDVHPWMLAWVGVFENSFFATTDADGNFSVKNVPAGKYQVVVYHPKTHGVNEGIVKEVTVGDAGAKESFEIEYKAP